MRKNVIALMLVLPILFVLVVYSAVNAASLDVQISASGIEIMERYPSDTVSIDLADYDGSYEITPRVNPANASNRDFSYRYERISGNATEEEVAAGKVVEVVKDEQSGVDRIAAHAAGTVRVVAVSKDGGYTDAITVIVGASKPYAFDFLLYRADDVSRTNVLEEGENGYTADVRAGQYVYGVRLKPNTYLSPSFEVKEGFLSADFSRGTVTFPFSGTTSFDVVIAGGVGGALTRTVTLNISGGTAGDFTVNGASDRETVVRCDRETRNVEFFVESSARPEVECDAEGADAPEVERVSGAEHGWRVKASLPSDAGDCLFYITVGGVTKRVEVVFSEFSFRIRSDIPDFDESEGATVLMGTPIAFYAAPDVVAAGISYRWDVINVDDERSVVREISGEDSSVCTITAKSHESFILVVEALRDGQPIFNGAEAREVVIESINNVVGVQSMDTRLGLANSLAVAGNAYVNGVKTKRYYPVPITAFSPAGVLEDGIADLDFSVSSRAVEIVRGDEDAPVVQDGCILLDVVGKGEVTLTATWKGNDAWSSDDPVVHQAVFMADGDAVEVTTSSQLFAATEAGDPVVLGGDIMLGTQDDNVTPLDLETRRGMLKSMRSTYNTQFYETLGQSDAAKVNYVIEFKNDVYGNGHEICGEYFSNAKDGAGEPLLFKGPLVLVSLGDMASVAAQDNIVFLCRTDGVTIHNATLLGASDAARINPDTGLDDLSTLTYTGTVLEINADVNVLNCRIRNGRNVVRVYGGNRDGQNYFIDSLSENITRESDRAIARLEGCILSHSREFVVKAGTNRALRASLRLGREPAFRDRNGKEYANQTNDYLADEYFYQTYVLTDLTVKDCVLEKSGLFCIGVETNFAGEALGEGSRFAEHELLGTWVGVGGTSFPTLLRLEGNVRMYDWKELGNINSDTLIEAGSQEFPLKLDIAAMITYMRSIDSDLGHIIEEEDDKQYVHGGIALYGGGRNYSQVEMTNFDEERANGLKTFNINISDLEDADGEVGGIGQLLPLAAGTQDFRFLMYEDTSSNNRAWQALSDYSVASVPFH